jgi:hypothetical protein
MERNEKSCLGELKKVYKKKAPRNFIVRRSYTKGDFIA